MIKEPQDRGKAFDKLAAIREVYDIFVAACKANYRLSKRITMDKMLAELGGRCPFRQYIPSKPAKYGIKILAMADASSFYVCDLEVYAGKQPPGPYEIDNSPAAVVPRLPALISGTGWNVTFDNWFTSYELVTDLLDNHCLTSVGTLRKNKREILKELLDVSKRPMHSSLFGFGTDMTLISYIPKKGKKFSYLVVCITMMQSTPD